MLRDDVLQGNIRMNRKRLTFISCIMILSNAGTSFAFNLLTTEETVKYIVSSVMEQLGVADANDAKLNKLPDNVRPSYFGYTLNFHEGVKDSIRFMIGSPKIIDATSPTLQDKSAALYRGSRGSVNSCAATKLFFSGEDPECVLAHPENPKIGDNLGFSVSSRPDGNMIACFPTRQKDCGDLQFTPGTCNRSHDFGLTWIGKKNAKSMACPTTDIEVLFVLDGSGSVGHHHFERVKSWVKDITMKLGLESGRVTVGVVQYSYHDKKKDIDNQPWIVTHIRIGDYSTYDSFAAAVDGIQLQGYTTYTGQALRKVLTDFKNTKHFGKPTTKQVMILLTDGSATDSEVVPKNAQKVRDLGVISYAVGVGDDKTINVTELRLIANGDKHNSTRVFMAENFSGLDAIAKELEAEIGGLVLEGETKANGTGYDMQFGQLGFSITYSKRRSRRQESEPTSDFGNGRLHLGAVGAYDWSGTVTKYDDVNDDEPDIPKYTDVQQVLPNRTKESYLGYSVVTGYFDSSSNEWVAAGAPRYMLLGAVVLYTPKKDSATFHNHKTLMGNPSKRQLGSYFGGSVMTADVNNDGKDDLFVGAPLYTASNYDEGRVFVFISTDFASWASDKYEPFELTGDNLPGGRFGTAIANAGDLNRDGYNDIIVGAPLTEIDRGAVFVYHGNGDDGIDTKFAQKILASELQGVQLKYFGQSLQGGVDLDDNKYPDIAVGAPKSDTVVIFRSRPVVKIDAEIKYLSGEIDIFECIENKDYQNCSEIEVCFTASGITVESEVGLQFNVTLDTKKAGATKRLEFRKSSELFATGTPTWTEPIQLPKDTKKCFTKNLHLKSNVADYDSAIESKLEFDLLPSHTKKPLSSVRDPARSNARTATLNFAKKCGDDEKCVHDLRIEASLSLPEYKTESGQDLTEEGKVLIVDQKTASIPVTVKVNLTNNGENAFDTKIKVLFTEQISLSTLDNRQAFPPSNTCMIEDSDPEDAGNGMKKQYFRYNYRSNIMRQDTWCYFEFNLITENLRGKGNLETFTVNVTAFTNDTSKTSSEKNENDNWKSESPKVKYMSDFTLQPKSAGGEVSFNFTEGKRNITSVEEIGEGTTDVQMGYEIRGEGYSNIPDTEVILTYPLSTSKNDMLLYLYQVDCEPKSKDSDASCACDQDLINAFNLTVGYTNENDTDMKNYRTITSAQYPIEADSFDCFNKNPDANITCASLRCRIQNLRDSEEINFMAYFRFWSSSVNFDGANVTGIDLHSRYEVTTKNSPFIIDENGEVSQTESEEILIKAKKWVVPQKKEEPRDITWIIILAAVGGLLLLIAIVLILWKVGFFKSKYADMKKDAQDDLADETDFQNNGNTAPEMVE